MTPEQIQALIDAGFDNLNSANDWRSIVIIMAVILVTMLVVLVALALAFISQRNSQRNQQFINDNTRQQMAATNNVSNELGLLRTTTANIVEMDIARTKALTGLTEALTALSLATVASTKTVERMDTRQVELKQDVKVMPDIIKLTTKEQLDDQSIHVLQKINARLDAGVAPKVGIVQINSVGRVVLVNPVALKLLGLSHEQTIGKPFYNLGLKVVNSDGKALEDFASLPFSEALSTGKLSIKHAIIGIQAQDKSYKWIAMEMQLIDGAEVPTPQILLTFVDAGEIITMEGETTGAYPKEAAPIAAAHPPEAQPETVKPPVHVVVDAPADTPATVVVATDSAAAKAAVAAVGAVATATKKAADAVEAANAEQAEEDRR